MNRTQAPVLRGAYSGILVATLAIATLIWPTAVGAQPASTGSVVGQVTDTSGTPLESATITLSGPQNLSTTSGKDGTFALDDVPAGLYTVTVTKSGYDAQTQANVLVTAGQPNAIDVALAQQTLTSLRIIGSVTTRAHGSINTSPAAEVLIPQSAFLDQGAVQVTQILNETPGIIGQYPGGTANPASPASVVLPIIRGALSYETSTLIDGHPLANQSYGDHVATYLNPFMFQSIELVKGPGMSATQDNYAINGTVNFRTLDPTPTRNESILLGVDSFGGQFSNFRATGTVLNGKLGYALDYAITGTPGPLTNSQGYFTGFSPSATYPVFINGVLVGSYATVVPAVPPPNVQNVPYNVDSLVGCCFPVSTNYLNRGELAKLRYNFSDETSMTLSFLGSQAYGDQSATGIYNEPMAFNPGTPLYVPAANAPVPGTTINTLANLYEPPYQPESNNEPVAQADFRAALTPDDNILARYYWATINRDVFNGLAGPASTYTTNMVLNGVFTPAAAGSVPVVFNNQAASVTFGGQFYQEVELDWLNGGSFEYDHALPKGAGLISVAFDETNDSSQEYEYEPAIKYLIWPGSQEVNTTAMLRALINIGPQLQFTTANYYNGYYFRYTNNGGASFNDEHTYEFVPRAGLVWRPDPDIAIRAAAGAAIAPPYLYLLDTTNTAPTEASSGTYWTETLAPPNGVRAETAFGYNVGADVRLGGYKKFTTDLYLNNVYNQFVQPYFLVGYCNATCSAMVPAGSAGALPLYGKTVENLANSRYAGIEFSYSDDPPIGIGGTVQGALIRAYAYNLGPCFYTINIAAGCTTPTTNLGIVNYANFGNSNALSASGSYNTLGDAVPYAMGYGEIHYRTRWGGLGSLGLTYFGNNNTFGLLPFFVVNATIRVPVHDQYTHVQVSAYNVTNAAGSGYGTAFAGTPYVILANGNYGLTNQKSLGPATLRLWISRDFGGT